MELELTKQDKRLLKRWISVDKALAAYPCTSWRRKLRKAQREGITHFTVDELYRRSNEFWWSTSAYSAMIWLETSFGLDTYNLRRSLHVQFHGQTKQAISRELDRVLYNK